MYVEPNQLPEHIRALCGKGPVRVELLNSGQTVTIGSQQWDGGSRDLWHIANLDTPTIKPLRDPRPWPENMKPLGQAPIAPRNVLVRTGTFCGKPSTPTVYALASDVSEQLAPPKVDLDAEESAVLKAIATLNSRGRKEYKFRHRISDAAWNATCQRLARKGLVKMNKNGAAAITTDGRNAAEQLPRVY